MVGWCNHWRLHRFKDSRCCVPRLFILAWSCAIQHNIKNPRRSLSAPEGWASTLHCHQTLTGHHNGHANETVAYHSIATSWGYAYAVHTLRLPWTSSQGLTRRNTFMRYSDVNKGASIARLRNPHTPPNPTSGSPEKGFCMEGIFHFAIADSTSCGTPPLPAVVRFRECYVVRCNVQLSVTLSTILLLLKPSHRVFSAM